GWDQYFGYGRINANSAVRRVAPGLVPPEAEISAPDWFQIVDPNTNTLTVSGRVAANRAASYSYTVDIAPGIQPAEAEFRVVQSAAGLDVPLEGTLAAVSLSALAERMPHGVDGPSIDESMDARGDPDRFTVTIRVRVVDSLGNRGEDRRAFFLHRDPNLIDG